MYTFTMLFDICISQISFTQMLNLSIWMYSVQGPLHYLMKIFLQKKNHSHKCSISVMIFFDIVICKFEWLFCSISFVFLFHVSGFRLLPLSRNNASWCEASQCYDRSWDAKTSFNRLGIGWVLSSGEGIQCSCCI